MVPLSRSNNLGNPNDSNPDSAQTRRMQPRVRNALIFLLTLGLLGVFLRSVNVAEVWGETRRANPWLLLLAVGVTGVTYAVRALRWQYLLAPIGPTHFSTAFRTTVIGFAATFLLPARAGEVIRPYLLARREGLNATAAFATIILERLLDLITVLLLFAWFVLTAAPDAVTGDPAQFARIKLFGPRRPRRRWPGRRCSSCWRVTPNAWAGWPSASSVCSRPGWPTSSRDSSRRSRRGWR